MLYELGDQLWRVLRVGIEDDNGVARGPRQARAQRRLMAEVARQTDALPAGVAAVQRADVFPGAVAGTVVDQDHFVRAIPTGAHGGADPKVQLREHVFFVQAGDQEGEHEKMRAILGPWRKVRRP